MNKIIFFSDLDNTIIHSWKHKTEDDVCVEINKGKEQGFISKEALELLKEVNKRCLFVPITTRSIEQFLRIDFGFMPEYAICANGGVLLHDGKVDDDYFFHIKEQISDSFVHFEPLVMKLLKTNKFIRVRIVNDSYVFSYCNNDVNPDDVLEEYKGIYNLSVIKQGKKIYYFPKIINKGDALANFVQKSNPAKIICAGDSNIDLPMLKLADEIYIPKNLEDNFKDFEGKVNVSNEDDFAVFILKNVLKGLEEGK